MTTVTRFSSMVLGALLFTVGVTLNVLGAGSASRSPVEPAKVAGKWNGRLQLESISGSPVLTFKQDGEKLTGTYRGYYGETPLDGTIKEKEIAFAVTFNIEGTKTQGIFTGTVDGDSMGGRVEFEGAGSGTWSAVRVKE